MPYFNREPGDAAGSLPVPLAHLPVHHRFVRLLLAAAFVAAAPLRAQTSFTLVSGSPVSAFGYEVGPYSGILGTGSSAQTLFIYCIDVAHTVTPGQQWEVNLTNLGTGAGIGTNTRSGDLELYRQAAWLTTQYAPHPEATADIQATIWNLFGTFAGVAPSSDYWFLQAQANYASADYSGFLVATDVNMALETSGQEFIIVTPEPSTVALFATGLLGVLGVAARSRRRRGAL
jgi:hypothetical protein